MDCAAALYAFLSTNPTVTAVFGTRIYPQTMKQGAALPTAVYDEIDPGIIHAMGGDDPMRRPTFEIECHGKTSLAAADALAAIEAALQDYAGPFGSLTCSAVLMDGGGEDYDPDTGTYWKSREFQFYVE